MSGKNRPHASFKERLAWCMKQGSLSVSDLHVWFKRAYPTVYLWVNKGVLPQGPRAAPAHAALTRLEAAIKGRKGFPVPVELSSLERPSYMVSLRDGTKLSPARSATKRMVRRSGKAPKRKVHKK